MVKSKTSQSLKSDARTLYVLSQDDLDFNGDEGLVDP